MNKVEIDCTRKCKSRKHGELLTSAITKRSVKDEALASYIRCTCANFNKAFDNEGRTALQMAASRGRRALAAWLARNSSDAFANAGDRESGYTALHRALFYGQVHVAVNLISLGVNMEIADKDDYKALDHVLLDRGYMRQAEPQPGLEPEPPLCDVYVWGTNSNYTLGTGSQHQRNVPELLSCFSRSTCSVQQVCLGKFHSVVVCGGEAWVCGQAARAGAAPATLLRPAPLSLPEPCVHAALTIDSTAFVLNSGAVVQYKLKDWERCAGQAGAGGRVRPAPVKPLTVVAGARGLAGSRAHLALWTPRRLYTWGRNLGQLGHSQREACVDVPTKVEVSLHNKEETSIQLVGVSEAATLFSTSRGDVYLLHRHMCKKIAYKQINLKQICVSGSVKEGGAYSRVTALLLTSVGQILLWQDTPPPGQLTRCVFGLGHQVVATHVSLAHETLYVTTRLGQAHAGTLRAPAREPEPARRRGGDKLAPSGVKLRRLPNLHRAVAVLPDADGLNFACLQRKPSCGVRAVPALSASTMAQQLGGALQEASVDDPLHDVVFKVGQKYFPAHIFIVASHSNLLYKQYQEQKLKNTIDKAVLTIENVNPEVFDRILRYMYTGTCDVLELGPCALKIKKEDLVKKDTIESDDVKDDLIEDVEISAFTAYKRQRSKRGGGGGAGRGAVEGGHRHCDPVKLVQAAAKRLGVLALHRLLDALYFKEGAVCVREGASYTRAAGGAVGGHAWERAQFPELADTALRCRDGAALPAHRCVLASRLDYFRGMFLHAWTESTLKSNVTLPINSNILSPIIDFLYTDHCPELETTDSIDFICGLLVVADQLFITRLREMCEVALAGLITLRNCAEMCQLAHTYNAAQLKNCCMEFICLNLSCLLEARSLDILSPELLEDITSYYCKINRMMASRIITPFYNAPTDEDINGAQELWPVDLESVDEELRKEEVEVKKKAKKKVEHTPTEKERMRYESVSSTHDLDVSNKGDVTLSLTKIEKEEVKKKWVEVPTAAQKQLKVIQARLKAIASAREVLNETPSENFTRLSKSQSFTASPTSKSFPSRLSNLPTASTSPTASRISFSPVAARLSVSPKEEVAENSWRMNQLGSSPIVIQVGTKLSQKQRKKLALQNQSLSTDFVERVPSNGVAEPKVDKPKNPWKVPEMPPSSSPRKPNTGFEQILADQKKLKDDSSRIMTKPLQMTQLEDKAIEELERFYNVQGADEEWITVRRIELQVASPQWLHAHARP